MTRTIWIATALALTAGSARAQISPYAAEPAREIAALSAEETASLLDGAGMGFARAAELNGVPGPRHSLDMADELHLDAAQREGLERIFARMQLRARSLGAAIVAAEAELDRLFRNGGANAEEVQRRTVALGTLYGELRASHLTAHVETAAVLNPHQSARYAELRGYDATAHDAPASEHGAHH